MIRKWSFRAALFLSALTLLCWIDFGTLTYSEQSELPAEEGIDYMITDSLSFSDRWVVCCLRSRLSPGCRWNADALGGWAAI